MVKKPPDNQPNGISLQKREYETPLDFMVSKLYSLKAVRYPEGEKEVLSHKGINLLKIHISPTAYLNRRV